MNQLYRKRAAWWTVSCYRPSGGVTSTLRWLGVAVASIVCVLASSVTHQLFVQVRPEVALSHQGEATLRLKIRLAPGAQAMLWNAETCNEPDPEAYRVVRSGVYSIPLSAIPGPAGAGTCVASSDGALAVFLPSSVPAR